MTESEKTVEEDSGDVNYRTFVVLIKENQVELGNCRNRFNGKNVSGLSKECTAEIKFLLQIYTNLITHYFDY